MPGGGGGSAADSGQVQTTFVDTVIRLVPGFTDSAAKWARRASGGLIDFTGTGGRPTLNPKQQAAFVAAGGTISNRHHGRANLQYSIGGKRIGGGAARQVARYQSGARSPDWGIGFDPKKQRTYVDAAGIRYPAPPKGWKGGVSEWQDIAIRRGWAIIPQQPGAPPPVEPPRVGTVVTQPSGFPNYAPVRAAQDVIRYAIIGQISEQIVGPLIREAMNKSYGRSTTRGPRSRSKRGRRLTPQRNTSPWGPPKPQAQAAPRPQSRAASLELVRITSQPMLERPTITAQRMPTTSSARAPSATPTARPSLLTRVRPILDLLTQGYLANRPGAATITGSRITYLTDPLTRPETTPLTSPLGSFAGVPSSPDCSCSKKPGKRGKRKRRTICYEGTYRENANGTRKLRKREVPCK